MTARRVGGLRWLMAGLVFCATLINFMDRLTISVLAPVIILQLRLTNLQFAGISTWFLIAYSASQAVSGRFYDRVGTKRGFTASVLVWSCAAVAHAFARGLASLSALRFVLGLGEAGNWPGAAKVMAEWMPARERALGMGIFNSGVSVGSIVAPPLIVWLQLTFGWKAAFLVTGSLGFLWLIAWQALYEAPDRHPALSRAELDLIRDGAPEAAATPESRAGRQPAYRALLGQRQVWAIVAARFVTDPVWWLYITWLPLYLYDVRGFSIKQIGLFVWLPYVAADAGSLLGGWLSGHLIARGWTVNRARKTVIVGGAALMLAGIAAARASSAGPALACIAVVLFGFQAWINNVQTLPSDWFPDSAVASVTGLGGAGAGVGAMLFTLTTGWVVDRLHSYTPILVTAALLPVLGTALLFMLGGTIRRVPDGDLRGS